MYSEVVQFFERNYSVSAIFCHLLEIVYSFCMKYDIKKCSTACIFLFYLTLSMRVIKCSFCHGRVSGNDRESPSKNYVER